MTTAIPRVSVAIARNNSGPDNTICGPGVCLVLQGTKQLVLGEETLRQDAGFSLATLVELPATRCLFETEKRAPYIAVGLTLDRNAFAELLADLSPFSSQRTVPCFSIANDSRHLLEAWDRHLELLDTPGDIPALAAVRERELLYRLLQSPHGVLLSQIARDEGRLAKMRRAIDWMRVHFDEPFSAKWLADIAGMSIPAFNRHFRTATSTSPLQYQKMLRLQAARHLLAKNTDATRTAYAVGYESASQFNREYARHFGIPPKRDALKLTKEFGVEEKIMI